jgi:hypothetical protein
MADHKPFTMVRSSRSRWPEIRNSAVLRVVAVPAKKVLDRVRHEIETLQKGGARPSDIAVLSLASRRAVA